MARRIHIYIVVAVAVLLATTPASAQHYVGAKLGYGGASGRFYPPRETGMFFGNKTAGVAWKYYSDQQVIGGVGVELEFQQRGCKIFNGNASPTTNYTLRRVSSVTMPLIWQPHLYFLDRKVRVFLNAAFTVTYNLGLNDTVTEVSFRDDGSGNMVSSSVTTPYKFVTARDNRWNYGIFGGFGFGVLLGRVELFAEARYYYGMSDIIRNYTKYTFQSEFLRSELDNLYINVGFFIRLGKGGIKAAPLKMNRNRDTQATFDFRNARPNY